MNEAQTILFIANDQGWSNTVNGLTDRFNRRIYLLYIYDKSLVCC